MCQQNFLYILFHYISVTSVYYIVIHYLFIHQHPFMGIHRRIYSCLVVKLFSPNQSNDQTDRKQANSLVICNLSLLSPVFFFFKPHNVWRVLCFSKRFACLTNVYQREKGKHSIHGEDCIHLCQIRLLPTLLSWRFQLAEVHEF